MQKMGVFGAFWYKYVKKTLLISLVLALCISVYNLGEKIYLDQQVSGLNFVVVLDAGHGGIDGGVVGSNTGTKESEINLEMVFLLKDLLEKGGFKVVLTRSDKNGLYGSATNGFKRRDMQKRFDVIRQAKANLVLSLHCNKFSDSSRSGPQVFFGDSQGQKLAQKMQTVLNDFTKNSHSALKGDYFMLKCTTSPSVIVECGFLSNPNDEAKLCDQNYRRQLAEVICKGVLLYLADGVVNDTV
ncbi:MAG: N-acetylmuramoyl-L-alanine amidase [Clostridia bacterium]|nr:N-acetylmuramoyl-L-alanine amidase [Clostridia bacterium]